MRLPTVVTLRTRSDVRRITVTVRLPTRTCHYTRLLLPVYHTVGYGYVIRCPRYTRTFDGIYVTRTLLVTLCRFTLVLLPRLVLVTFAVLCAYRVCVPTLPVVRLPFIWFLPHYCHTATTFAVYPVCVYVCGSVCVLLDYCAVYTLHCTHVARCNAVTLRCTHTRGCLRTVWITALPFTLLHTRAHAFACRMPFAVVVTPAAPLPTGLFRLPFPVTFGSRFAHTRLRTRCCAGSPTTVTVYAAHTAQLPVAFATRTGLPFAARAFAVTLRLWLPLHFGSRFCSCHATAGLLIWFVPLLRLWITFCRLRYGLLRTRCGSRSHRLPDCRAVYGCGYRPGCYLLPHLTTTRTVCYLLRTHTTFHTPRLFICVCTFTLFLVPYGYRILPVV